MIISKTVYHYRVCSSIHLLQPLLYQKYNTLIQMHCSKVSNVLQFKGSPEIRAHASGRLYQTALSGKILRKCKACVKNNKHLFKKLLKMPNMDSWVYGILYYCHRRIYYSIYFWMRARFTKIQEWTFYIKANLFYEILAILKNK